MFDRIASQGLGPKLAKAALSGASRRDRAAPPNPAPPAAPGPDAETFAADYAVHLGGLRLGLLALRLARAEGRYAATGGARSAGAVARVLALSAEAEAAGTFDAEGHRPDRARIEGALSEERRRLDIAYAPAFAIAAEPPFPPRPHDADAQTLAGALDPLSAAVALFAPRPEAALGPSTLIVSEGRRVAALAIGPAERTGGFWRAEAEARPVAGLSPERLARGPFPLRLWWDGTAGRAVFLRAEASTPLGPLRIARL